MKSGASCVIDDWLADWKIAYELWRALHESVNFAYVREHSRGPYHLCAHAVGTPLKLLRVGVAERTLGADHPITHRLHIIRHFAEVRRSAHM